MTPAKMFKTWTHKSKPQEGDQAPSETGEVYDDDALAHDAVFGDMSEKGPNYRDVRLALLQNGGFAD